MRFIRVLVEEHSRQGYGYSEVIDIVCNYIDSLFTLQASRLSCPPVREKTARHLPTSGGKPYGGGESVVVCAYVTNPTITAARRNSLWV